MNNLDLKQTKPEVLAYADKNELLYHLRYLSLKDFHVEMYKILKDTSNNKDNIFGLLRNLQADNSKCDEANQLLSDLNAHAIAIKGVNDARDKYYAHLDSDYEKYIIRGIPIADLYKCFELVERAIIILSSIEYLKSFLEKIPSRDEFELSIP